jgi:glucose-1-phosphate thymidylyltransferase
MKGVVLAGGLGTRLLPLTKVTNKHLLPVYDKPMIYYPLESLAGAGIDEIMLVTGGESAGDFLRLLGNGAQFGLKQLEYAYQEGAGGIAAALSLCEDFVGDELMCVALGDNILQEELGPYRSRFESQGRGARLLLKEVPDPGRFGVPEIVADRIVRIEEKPAAPKSRYAVTGIYFYDRRAFDFIRLAKPSARNELEITDVNNSYIALGELQHNVLEGWWTDAGQFESLHRAANLVARERGVARQSR